MTRLGVDGAGNFIPCVRPGKTQTVSISGTAASSSQIQPTTTIARIVATTDCHYSLNNAATSSSSFLPANVVEYISIAGGDTISFIQNTAAGTAYITEAA